MRILAIFAMGSACLVAGCDGTGANYQPLIDGPKTVQFQSDLGECQALSRTRDLINPQARTQATIGAVVGGLAGGLDEDAGSDRLENAVGGALIGGLIGTATGAAETHSDREDIIKNCLIGRGYSVVG